jgi:hypothetical protein
MAGPCGRLGRAGAMIVSFKPPLFEVAALLQIDAKLDHDQI